MRISLINLTPVASLNSAIAYLTGALSKTHHQVNLIDLAFQQNHIKYCLEAIRLQTPDVVGFSCISTDYPRSLLIAKEIKKRYPKLLLIWGGIHAILYPDEVITNPYADAICIGEGERALIEFLNDLENERRLDVEGFWYKDGEKIIRNKRRSLEEDLDKLEFCDWRPWDLHLYFRNYIFPYSLPVLSSRGCIFDCSFCSSPALREHLEGRYYRVRSVENVIAELIFLLQNFERIGLKGIIFRDDLFGLDFNWFSNFIIQFKKAGLNKKLYWVCETRADLITKDWAKMAGSAGCLMVGLGLECGDENYRFKVYNKKIANQTYKNAIKLLQKNDILTAVNVIIGAPGEKKSNLRKTFSFVKELKSDFTIVNKYLPIPGTKLMQRWEEGRLTETAKIKYWINKKILFWKLRTGINLVIKGFYIWKFRYLIYIFKFIFSNVSMNNLFNLFYYSQILRRLLLEYHLNLKNNERRFFYLR